MKYKNIIAGGCSFTADGIGGVPPTVHMEGGNSFLDYPGRPAEQPQTWTGILAQKLQVTSFVNLAAHGHGNTVTAMVIPALFEQFNYQSSNTMVLFNITEPERMDYVCGADNPYRSGFTPWGSDLLPLNFIAPVSTVMAEMRRNQGIENIQHQTVWALKTLFFWLKQNDIDYLFTMMYDYTDHPGLGPLLKPRLDRCVYLGDTNNMMDFANKNNMLSNDRLHPSVQAHQAIAKYTLDKLSLLS